MEICLVPIKELTYKVNIKNTKITVVFDKKIPLMIENLHKITTYNNKMYQMTLTTNNEQP